MDRSHLWWGHTDAHWDGTKYRWTFPSGAKVSFGYLENENDHLRYQGGEYQMVGFDELTQLRENQYLYLFSRLRRLTDSGIPIRSRSATNPGGPGHEWVRKRFKLPTGPVYPHNIDRKFIDAKLRDNPYLDQEEYLKSLEQLPELTRKQLLEGDWSALGTGGYFHPESFNRCTWAEVPEASAFRNLARTWDFGATEVTELSPDPDWTVGAKIGIVTNGKQGVGIPDWYIFDIIRFRGNPGTVEYELIKASKRDGMGVSQWLEQERGAAGKLLGGHYAKLLAPHDVRSIYADQKKEVRAAKVAGRVDARQIYLVEGEWNDDFLAECAAFPEGSHDDQVDAFSNGVLALEREKLMTGGRIVRVGKAMKGRRRRITQSVGVHYGY